MISYHDVNVHGVAIRNSATVLQAFKQIFQILAKEMQRHQLPSETTDRWLFIGIALAIAAHCILKKGRNNSLAKPLQQLA